ncbi:cell wall biogenesis and architecture protein, partial [Teratosphaeriaceae sp. CCFEE 6253]
MSRALSKTIPALLPHTANTAARAGLLTTTRPAPHPRHAYAPTHPPQARHSSHSPPSAHTPTTPPRKKITLPTLLAMHARADPITMLTAHDFPSAAVADAAGMDMLLVGDSLAMVSLGLTSTAEITLDEMLLHCRSVARGAGAAFVVGDLPMGCYEVSPEQAVQSAIRMVKEGRVQGVKLEGGLEMAGAIARIVAAGIPVLAHVGLTPQRQNALGGFR